MNTTGIYYFSLSLYNSSFASNSLNSSSYTVHTQNVHCGVDWQQSSDPGISGLCIDFFLLLLSLPSFLSSHEQNLLSHFAQICSGFGRLSYWWNLKSSKAFFFTPVYPSPFLVVAGVVAVVVVVAVVIRAVRITFVLRLNEPLKPLLLVLVFVLWFSQTARTLFLVFAYDVEHAAGLFKTLPRKVITPCLINNYTTLNY